MEQTVSKSKFKPQALGSAGGGHQVLDLALITKDKKMRKEALVKTVW